MAATMDMVVFNVMNEHCHAMYNIYWMYKDQMLKDLSISMEDYNKEIYALNLRLLEMMKVNSMPASLSPVAQFSTLSSQMAEIIKNNFQKTY